MKFLYVLLPFCFCASAQSAQSISLNPISLPSAVLINSVAKKPVSISMTDVQLLHTQNYSALNIDFAKDKSLAVRALRENLQIADPMMRPMYVPGSGYQGTPGGGALDMLSPRTDYSNY